jgi:hypothetical protein
VIVLRLDSRSIAPEEATRRLVLGQRRHQRRQQHRNGNSAQESTHGHFPSDLID